MPDSLLHRPLDVLLIEDSPADARLVHEMLRESGRARITLTHADRLRAAIDLLRDQGFDAILLDLSLPDSQGLATFMRAREEAPGAPIVVLTGLADEEMALRAVAAGAQDYLVKGQVDGGHLYHAIRYAVQRHNIEEELRESEERFRELAEHVREVFFVVEPANGKALYLSPAYDRTFGMARNVACDKPYVWLSTIHPEDRDRAMAILASEQVGEGAEETELRVVHADESIHWIRVSASAVHDERHQVVRIVGIAQDVTELRETRTQFLRAQRLEAVGRLAGGVAHDFNNLLTVIAGRAEMLAEDTARDSPLQDDIAELLQATERAAALTRQLLAFSRQQVLEPRRVALNALVDDMDRMLRRLIGEDIALRTVMANPLSPILADPGQLEQVLMNLVVNARDAMPSGGSILIETMPAHFGEPVELSTGTLPAGDYVALVVTDTGTGIPEDVRARLFEPFFTTKEPGRGTGLGLATVYGIVRQSGGGIAVYSELGRGSTFRVLLPALTDGAAVSAAGRVAPPTAQGGHETILLVEDEAPVRSLAVAALKRRGYTVIEAGSAEEALQVVDAGNARIDLLLTDTVMPGLSGPELARRLRERHPNLRVLLMSGYTERALSIDEPLPARTLFLGKPFTGSGLAGKVREALDRL